MKWWRRRRRPSRASNGDAVQAKRLAADAVRRAQRRWPEVHAARDTFVAQMEAALARPPGGR